MRSNLRPEKALYIFKSIAPRNKHVVRIHKHTRVYIYTHTHTNMFIYDILFDQNMEIQQFFFNDKNYYRDKDSSYKKRE